MEVSNKRRLVTTIIVTTIGVYLTIRFILPLVAPFIMAYAIAALILPLTRLLEKKCKIPKTIGGTLALFALLLSAGIGLLYLGENLIEQFQMFMKNFPVYQSMIVNSVDSFCNGCDRFLGLAKGEARAFFDGNINTMLLEVQTNLMPKMTEQTFQVAFKIVGIVGTLIFTIISILLIVQDADEIKKKYKLLPFYKEIHSVTGKLSGAGIAYLKAQLIIMSIISVINISGLLLIKNKYALLVGIGVAILDALPVFGSGTIFIPWAVISFFSKDIFQAAVLISLYFVTQLIRQMLEPKLIGDKIGIKPIFTIMSMYAGIKLFGVFGFLLGPIGLIIIISIIKTVNVYEKVPKDT